MITQEESVVVVSKKNKSLTQLSKNGMSIIAVEAMAINKMSGKQGEEEESQGLPVARDPEAKNPKTGKKWRIGK